MIPQNKLSEEAKTELNENKDKKKLQTEKIDFIEQMNIRIILKLFKQ